MCIRDRPDARIPGLEGPRANCVKRGIFDSDVLLVPLEDGDRCEALMAMGKTVLVIDLNPLSRTAQMASVTMVDELSRVVENMNTLMAAEELPEFSNEYNNDYTLQDALDHIKNFLTARN